MENGERWIEDTTELAFVCKRHGEQQIERARQTVPFNFFQLILSCGCKFQNWDDDKFTYVGRLVKID